MYPLHNNGNRGRKRSVLFIAFFEVRGEKDLPMRNLTSPHSGLVAPLLGCQVSPSPYLGCPPSYAMLLYIHFLLLKRKGGISRLTSLCFWHKINCLTNIGNIMLSSFFFKRGENKPLLYLLEKAKDLS